MTTKATARKHGSTKAKLGANDFLHGFLSALAVLGHTDLSSNSTSLHRAFGSVLKKLDHPATRKWLNVDSIDVDFDPLYGMSPWFDRALTRAQRDMLISFPNPSYDRLEIRFGKDEAEQKLKAFGRRSELLELAREFTKNL